MICVTSHIIDIDLLADHIQRTAHLGHQVQHLVLVPKVARNIHWCSPQFVSVVQQLKNLPFLRFNWFIVFFRFSIFLFLLFLGPFIKSFQNIGQLSIRNSIKYPC